MPTYGYRCGSCGHEFEILQKITAEPLEVCPNCQGKLTKKVYAAGVIFTGSGYYTTDYKSTGKGESTATSNGDGSSSEKSSDGKSKSETKETKSESSSASKSESKAESKPESKSNSKTEKAS